MAVVGVFYSCVVSIHGIFFYVWLFKYPCRKNERTYQLTVSSTCLYKCNFFVFGYLDIFYKVKNAFKNAVKNASKTAVGGKGFLVHEYAAHVGAKVVFALYHTAWNEFNK